MQGTFGVDFLYTSFGRSRRTRSVADECDERSRTTQQPHPTINKYKYINNDDNEPYKPRFIKDYTAAVICRQEVLRQRKDLIPKASPKRDVKTKEKKAEKQKSKAGIRGHVQKKAKGSTSPRPRSEPRSQPRHSSKFDEKGQALVVSTIHALNNIRLYMYQDFHMYVTRIMYQMNNPEAMAPQLDPYWTKTR
ncbi:hypothetical protein BGZ65_002190 [Modicella reniformis]|uniref:Uncharacterized protein n=1 Tax=Modicella reniformis TaxID=1440133 RepID=A0A9P6M0K4_9FUNG|nr:hypothetical protein BGZ65_002190 [Modicella reniformis]